MEFVPDACCHVASVCVCCRACYMLQMFHSVQQCIISQIDIHQCFGAVYRVTFVTSTSLNILLSYYSEGLLFANLFRETFSLQQALVLVVTI